MTSPKALSPSDQVALMLKDLSVGHACRAFITGGCSRRGVQWIGVVLYSKLVYNVINHYTLFPLHPPLRNVEYQTQTQTHTHTHSLCLFVIITIIITTINDHEYQRVVLFHYCLYTHTHTGMRSSSARTCHTRKHHYIYIYIYIYQCIIHIIV